MVWLTPRFRNEKLQRKNAGSNPRTTEASHEALYAIADASSRKRTGEDHSPGQGDNCHGEAQASSRIYPDAHRVRRKKDAQRMVGRELDPFSWKDIPMRVKVASTEWNDSGIGSRHGNGDHLRRTHFPPGLDTVRWTRDARDPLLGREDGDASTQEHASHGVGDARTKLDGVPRWARIGLAAGRTMQMRP